MSKIIMNADDFGLSAGVNLGILHCYQTGAINSATLLTNTLFFDQAVEMIQEHHLQNIGLHVNLTEFKSLLNTHQTITDSAGNFFRDVCNLPQINPQEVYNEIEAQYFKAIHAGVAITHLDSHHHVHMSAALRKPFIAFSKKYQLPIRKINFKTRNPLRWMEFYLDTRNVSFYTDHFSADFYDDTISMENLQNVIRKHPIGSLEIMCHPGYQDINNGIYDVKREQEINVLTSNITL